jgi:hypothetical protein
MHPRTEMPTLRQLTLVQVMANFNVVVPYNNPKTSS